LRRLLFTSALDGREGSAFTPSPLDLEKTPAPIDWCHGGPQGRSGRSGKEKNVLYLPGFEPELNPE